MIESHLSVHLYALEPVLSESVMEQNTLLVLAQYREGSECSDEVGAR